MSAAEPRPGQPCKVRRRGPSGQGFIWIDGTFGDVHGRGAFVYTPKDGNRNFYHWNEIEYVPPVKERALATLGDALLARSNGKVELEPGAVTVSAPPWIPPPPPPPTPDRSQIIAVPPEPPKSEARARAPLTPHRHRATQIGNRLRECRFAKRDSQVDVAHGVGISATRVSNIETGAIIPNSDELVLFSAYFEVPLEELEALGDAPAETTPARAAVRAAAPPVAAAPSDALIGVLAAVIEALAPLPVRERRGILEPLLKVLP